MGEFTPRASAGRTPRFIHKKKSRKKHHPKWLPDQPASSSVTWMRNTCTTCSSKTWPASSRKSRTHHTSTTPTPSGVVWPLTPVWPWSSESRGHPHLVPVQGQGIQGSENRKLHRILEEWCCLLCPHPQLLPTVLRLFQNQPGKQKTKLRNVKTSHTLHKNSSSNSSHLIT